MRRVRPAQATPTMPAIDGPSVDAAEVARFSSMAEAWWDPLGKFRPLHKLNPVRVAYIRDRVAAHFGRAPLAERPFAGLRLLDIGCGGGLLAEPMARLGATVVGIDASERNIAIARLHAAKSGLAIDYRATTAEALAEAGERFDVILNMEVIEHVADVGAFLGACCALLAPGEMPEEAMPGGVIPGGVIPGGVMVLATLNRTPQSFAFAIVGAEYVLGWLPRGTHDWHRFLRPSELAARLRAHGARVSALAGLRYHPLGDRFALADDLSVNYMAVVERT